MTINLTELRDEPLGKHPIQAAVYLVCQCYDYGGGGMEDEQDVIPANSESSFTFDVDGLSDEALDISYTPTALCFTPYCLCRPQPPLFCN